MAVVMRRILVNMAKREEICFHPCHSEKRSDEESPIPHPRFLTSQSYCSVSEKVLQLHFFTRKGKSPSVQPGI